MGNGRQKTELGDILAVYEQAWLNKKGLCPVQRKAYRAITRCRTAALGGHLNSCTNCGHGEQAYNSCRNRHCPKCQFLRKAQWVDRLAANLPATQHFHLVFTVPDYLNSLFYLNQKEAYNLLFKAASQALLQCAKNPEYLGAKVGAVGILHTWGQNLSYHPHIHMIVPAGGLSEDGREWIPSARNFLLPVKVLSRMFRGILCKLIGEGLANGRLVLPDAINSFESLRKRCYKTDWVVYSEKPFKSSQNLINYLGNYTHRVAIANERIKSHEDGAVSFSYKNYRCGRLRKTMTLQADEFIRRFMQHVLPKGFCKVRYYGFMALCNIKQAGEACNRIIRKVTYLPMLQELNAQEVYRILSGNDPVICPKCKHRTIVKKPLLKQMAPG